MGLGYEIVPAYNFLPDSREIRWKDCKLPPLTTRYRASALTPTATSVDEGGRIRSGLGGGHHAADCRAQEPNYKAAGNGRSLTPTSV